ncbi:MAG TPA: PhnD/SsuA/transferrin family substrate-binding protein [Xanthobacteraceae bacterium]|jgi:4,5-dihydroxyphthalate decarboxylase|nr:PhnD/SsuA/transferrin family substrate-binding protein [Xanthobacteraceae bacterium]
MADQPKLKIAIGTYGHTRALKWGDVRIEGVEPAFVEVVPIIGAFRRMVRDVEFDICEMAPTTYMIARALGAPYIALPIFLMRRFHHGGFVVRPDAGIKVPKDLEGKKVGVRAYSVTTGVWTRGIFVNEYGLDSGKVTWVVDDEEHVTTLKLPPNVVHAPDGKSLQSMMKAGEIQAGFTGPAGVGRAGPPISGWDKAGAAAAAADTYPELIADVEKVEAGWFRKSGIYPIHGLIVVKDEHIKRHPWLARSLMNAFVAAKKPYLEELKQGQGDSPEDKRYRNFLSLMNDPLPYGSAANRPSIEALVTYSLQQKLIPARPQLDQVFVDIDP